MRYPTDTSSPYRTAMQQDWSRCPLEWRALSCRTERRWNGQSFAREFAVVMGLRMKAASVLKPGSYVVLTLEGPGLADRIPPASWPVWEPIWVATEPDGHGGLKWKAPPAGVPDRLSITQMTQLLSAPGRKVAAHW